MSADLFLDIEELVGELPEIPCEAPEHETSRLHKGPATHYARLLHNCRGLFGVVTLCGPAVAFVQGFLGEHRDARCKVCGWIGPYKDFIQILGPIKGDAS